MIQKIMFNWRVFLLRLVLNSIIPLYYCVCVTNRH